MRTFDFIVLGIGGMGSAALYHLARRGCRVLGLERFDLAHDRGSSHGETRIIRKAYFEHPAYVPLLERAYQRWAELEAERGEPLLTRCGLLLSGPPDGAVLRGVRRAASEHRIPIEEVPAAEVPRRFPGFALSEGTEAVLEPDGGFLRVEACVRAYAERAVVHGAELHTREPARSVRLGARQVTVETERGRYGAAGLVVCGGPYSGSLLARLGRRGGLLLPLTVRRRVMLWFGAGSPYRLGEGCPAFAFDTRDGFFYGFPVLDDRGLKAAAHGGGPRDDGAAEAVADPAALDRALRPEDEAPVRAFLRRHLPQAAAAPLTRHAACMYTMTPDEHFVIDRHPRHPRVAYACGFSGHGFKFASVVGEALADLALHGRSDLPIEFLAATRLRSIEGARPSRTPAEVRRRASRRALTR